MGVIDYLGCIEKYKLSYGRVIVLVISYGGGGGEVGGVGGELKWLIDWVVMVREGDLFIKWRRKVGRESKREWGRGGSGYIGGVCRDFFYNCFFISCNSLLLL